MTLPVRLDVNDPAFKAWQGQPIAVTVDGVPQEQVTAYDTEAGTVTRHKLDAAGNAMIDYEREEFVTEVVTGQVAVSLA